MEECLGLKSAIVKPESGKSADKKSTKQQHTANPAIQSRTKCPTCGLDHDISLCPKEQEKQRQAVLKRGNFYQAMKYLTNKEDTVTHHKAEPSDQIFVVCISHLKNPTTIL